LLPEFEFLRIRTGSGISSHTRPEKKMPCLPNGVFLYQIGECDVIERKETQVKEGNKKVTVLGCV